jgi:hypothetical protein
VTDEARVDTLPSDTEESALLLDQIRALFDRNGNTRDLLWQVHADGRVPLFDTEHEFVARYFICVLVRTLGANRKLVLIDPDGRQFTWRTRPPVADANALNGANTDSALVTVPATPTGNAPPSA